MQIDRAINEPCPNCGSNLVIRPDHGGKVTCGKCGETTSILPEWQEKLDLFLRISPSEV